MTHRKWLLLQIFAGEGAPAAGSAEAAGSGDTGADAGHRHLLELGVPADKIRNRANREPDTAGAPQQAAAAQPNQEESKPERMSWEQIKQDPEYSQHLQSMIQARLRSAKQAQETLTKLTPALETMARAYGLDTDKLDYDALAKAIRSDDRLYTEKALELGVSPQIARKLEQLEQIQTQQKKQQEQTARDMALRQHYGKLQQQAEAMKRVYPGFDLQRELQNPVFVRLTAPNTGVSVEDAYYTVHRRQLQAAAMQVTAQATARKISNAIQSGSRRPEENGTASVAPSLTAFDYRGATKAHRDALKQQIRAAAAQGRKVYPGQG